jgi:protoporphyrin/coproporphyrin ferrochelatase
MQKNDVTGVVLMTYGSATTADKVAEFMQHVYPKGVPAGVVEDFEERYRLVGRSPLIDITRKQAELTERALGDGFVVRAGMQHSSPFIDEAVAECKKHGATRLIGVILAPQYSPLIMRGYIDRLNEAAARHGIKEVQMAEPWGTEKHFVELMAKRVGEAVDRLKTKNGVNPPVVFTTHSLPKRVVERDLSYLDQLKQTAEAVAKHLDPALKWEMAYQSAGHTPEDWLKPDLMDVLARMRDKGDKAVLIVPLQFLADHLEILYDLDIAGGEQCADYGIEYNRIELPNTDPKFIEALGDVVRNTVQLS